MNFSIKAIICRYIKHTLEVKTRLVKKGSSKTSSTVFRTKIPSILNFSIAYDLPLW